MRKGNYARGENHPRSKLTIGDVLMIKRLRNQGHTQLEVAMRFIKIAFDEIRNETSEALQQQCDMLREELAKRDTRLKAAEDFAFNAALVYQSLKRTESYKNWCRSQGVIGF